MLKPIHEWCLGLASVPDTDCHVIRGREESVGMVGRELYFPHCKLVASYLDQRLVYWRSEVKDLNGVVSGASGHIVLILVEVTCKNLIVVGLHGFDCLESSQIPNSECFVSRARCDDLLMSRVPHGLVDNKVMTESEQRLGAVSIPDLESSVVWRTHKSSFVDMAPFHREDFSWVLCKGVKGLGMHEVPKSEDAITSSSDNLGLISFIKCCVITRVLGNVLLHWIHNAIRIELGWEELTARTVTAPFPTMPKCWAWARRSLFGSKGLNLTLAPQNLDS